MLAALNVISAAAKQVTAQSIFAGLVETQSRIDTLTDHLANHIYCDLVIQFDELCIKRGLSPSPDHFAAWIAMQGDGDLDVISNIMVDRYEQDLQDKVKPERSEDVLKLLESLKKKEVTAEQPGGPTQPDHIQVDSALGKPGPVS